MNITTATADQLHAAVRYTWKAQELREQADQLEQGTHEFSKIIPATALPATVKSMRAEANQIEADAKEADEELARRRAALPPFWGYVS